MTNKRRETGNNGHTPRKQYRDTDNNGHTPDTTNRTLEKTYNQEWSIQKHRQQYIQDNDK